jgi:hypothetical protein
LDDLIIGALHADVSGKSKAGKSYVIFGKKDSTAIDLSAIASGSGTGGLLLTVRMWVTGVASQFPVQAILTAVETEQPLKSFAFSPLITNPPVPLAIADRLIAVLSVLPKTI